MAKAFSEQERKVINEKLIAACEECWNLYGYPKTNIRDLCSKAGISSGAFYLFYKSKELLFVETAITAIKRLASIIDQNMPPANPAKQDLARAFKIMAKKIAKAKWLLSLEDTFEVFRRRLPPETFKDFIDLYSFQVEKYQFSPKVSHRVGNAALGALITLRLNPKMSGKDYDKAYELIVDSTIDRLFA
ncbi:MAG: TetR/AcrR family transcriptional regulator [Treponema sp.]|jgi:AcrR family transcriptional regulator|nr:TetR/AcrR family transcriptional regulator [Treponema sp.]